MTLALYMKIHGETARISVDATVEIIRIFCCDFKLLGLRVSALRLVSSRLLTNVGLEGSRVTSLIANVMSHGTSLTYWHRPAMEQPA